MEVLNTSIVSTFPACTRIESRQHMLTRDNGFISFGFFAIKIMFCGLQKTD
jgi:hypothetical protein